MSRFVSPVLAASAAVFFLATAACSGESAEPIPPATEQQELKMGKDGRPTGDGVVCSWDGIAIPGVIAIGGSTPGHSGDSVEPYEGSGSGSTGTAPSSGDTKRPPSPTPTSDDIAVASPLPGPYKLHERFPSLDGCNVCECTDAGIMCTMRECSGPTPEPKPLPPGDACPEDARVCADGSVVTRSGPSCAFAPCPTEPTEPPACTMDAKVCPDGSAVGRTGPRCEFVCPK